jgi:hypothetical protein
MAVKKETIDGTKIINEIDSSTIVKTTYDTESKDLVVEFKGGMKYRYDEVPHAVYTKFRMSESQGKYFSTDIAKKFKYTKLEN